MLMRSMEHRVEDAMPPESMRVRDDEFSLGELVWIIRRQWLWLLTSLLFCVLAAFAYIALSTTSFESRASIRIGKIFQKNGKPSAIEDVDTLAFQLVAQYGSERSDESKGDMPYLERATKAPGQEILRLVAVGRSPGEAKEFLAQVIAKLMQRHEEIYSTVMEPLGTGLKAVDRQIVNLTAQATELGKLADRLKESNPAQASLVAIERGHLLGKLTELERDYVGLQQMIARPHSSPSEVVGPPVASENPVSPSKPAAIAVAVVFGVILGAVVIFLREWLAKGQITRRQSSPPSGS